MKLHYIPNPHPICKISRYTLLFISHTVQNVKVHVQAMCSESQCAGATCVICSPQLSLELHHLGTFQTPLQQAGRVSFSRGDAPLPILVFAISPVWQADFLCIGNSQAAIIRDMWDSPRISQIQQSTKPLWWGDTFTFERLEDCFLQRMGAALDSLKLRWMLGESTAIETTFTYKGESAL